MRPFRIERQEKSQYTIVRYHSSSSLAKRRMGFCVSATGSVQSLSLALDDKANSHQLRFTDSDYSSCFDEGSYSFAFFALEAQGSSFSKPCPGRCCFRVITP